MKYISALLFIALGIWLARNEPDIADQILNFASQSIDWAISMIEGALAQ